MKNPFINFGEFQNQNVTRITVTQNDGKFYRKGPALIYKNGQFLKDAPSYEDAVKEARKLARSAKPAKLYKEPVQDAREDVEEFIDEVEDQYEEDRQQVQNRGGFWSLGPLQ